MKKIICLLLLIQSGFIMAQTKTVVTPNGEKVIINPYVNDGLTTNNGYIQLGGTLTQPTVLTTTSVNTLTISGLQTGSTSDNVLVADTNGVLKFVSRTSLGGNDNLGNHTATSNLEMSGKNINNAANIIATGKTSTNTIAIAKGIDGRLPVAGYVATAADASGNVAWMPLEEVKGTSSIQFFKQSTGGTTGGSTTWGNVPGFSNITYTSPADGDMIVTLVLYSALFENPSAGTPAMTNTQMQFTVNGTSIAYGMSTPIGIGGGGFNPECTTIIAKFSVTKGTSYTFSVQARDVWKSNTNGAYVGTFNWSGYTSPSTIMGMLITK